jgi:hypothetical protein
MGRDMVPTDREIQLAAKWMRLARLVRQSIETRSDSDPCEIKDSIQQYAVLALLLDDSVVEALFEDGEASAARGLRKEHRSRYRELIRAFERDAKAEWQQCVLAMDNRGEWVGYSRVLWRRCLGMAVAALLRGAFALHAMRAPGGCAIACLATRHIRQCLSPGAKVIPIRAS